MRVDFTNYGPEPPEKKQTGRAGQTGNGETRVSNASASSSGVDQTRDETRVSFAFDQTRVHTLADQVLAQPEVRQAKVQPLRQEIENGQYSVPPNLIADAVASEFGAAQG